MERGGFGEDGAAQGEVSIGLGGFVVEVVGEGDNELGVAGKGHFEADDLPLGVFAAIFGCDVEGAEVLFAKADIHFGGFGSGLTGGGVEFQLIGAWCGGFEIKGGAGFTGEVAREAFFARLRLVIVKAFAVDFELECFGLLEGGGSFSQFERGTDVLFHEHGRDGKDIADGVEAVAAVVRGEGVGGAGVEVEEIADGVVVFGAVEAAAGDLAGVGFGGVHPEDVVVDPAHDVVALLEGGLVFVLRGHHMGGELLADEVPEGEVGEEGVEVCGGIEGEVAFVDAIGVAVETDLLEDGADALLVVGGSAVGFSG